MSTQGISLLFLFFFIVAGLVLSAVPSRVDAMGAEANAICFEPGMCRYGTRCGKNGPPGVIGKPCQDVTSNLTITGACVAPFKCEGSSGQGAGGEGLQAVTQALGQIMQQLMQGGGGGGGAGEMPTTTYGGASCTSYYQVTTPSSDPCAIYNPSAVLDAAAGGSSGISGSLLDALNGGGSTTKPPISGQLNAGATTTTNTQPTTNPATNTGGTTTGNPQPGAQGLSGDVRVGSAGATVVANLRQGLSEVAGFFGGSTGGASGALSAAGRLCSTRPWQGSFVSNVIPTAFFDGLCEWRGYQVGIVNPQNNPRTTTSTSGSVQATTRPGVSLQPQGSNVPPEVDIWAEPASVRLGTRTYIFWNARGVASCKATGPSFMQTSLSGGASTVPITGATTFDIECFANASTTVRDSVTVQIAI